MFFSSFFHRLHRVPITVSPRKKLNCIRVNSIISSIVGVQSWDCISAKNRYLINGILNKRSHYSTILLVPITHHQISSLRDWVRKSRTSKHFILTIRGKDHLVKSHANIWSEKQVQWFVIKNCDWIKYSNFWRRKLLTFRFWLFS